jgi:hypothetical protein
MARRKRKPMMKAQRLNSIGATDIRRARGDVITENVEVVHETGIRQVLYNVDRVQDFVTRYWRQGAINDRQWKAGRTFARDAETALVGVPSQLGRDGTGGGDGERKRDAAKAALFASSRVRMAMRAAGRDTALLIWVAVDGRSAHEWAENNHIAPPLGIRMLRVALGRLADHYGIKEI